MFKKLRALMNLWFDDMSHENPCAEQLLMHIYRWLAAPTGAKLYDPLLHRLVHKLMKKSFYQLVYQLKQLGCRIVYASFHKIIVDTQRESFDEAENFVGFVTHTLRQKPLFQNLFLAPREFWRILLFKDIYNFGGIKESNPTKASTKFDVALHLPEACRRKFLLTITDFVIKVNAHNERLRREGPERAEDPLAPEKKVESYMDLVDDVKKERDHDFIEGLISDYFSHKLFQAISDFAQKKEVDAAAHLEQEEEEEEAEDEEDLADFGASAYERARKKREKERLQRQMRLWEFPKRIGSYNDYKNAALEFSKQICKNVFGLDPAFSAAANSLKRNLLKILREQEFSHAAVDATEPSLILVLPDVTCDKC